MRLDRYILVEWLKTLALVTGATFGVLMLQSLYNTVPELLEFRASAGRMLLYYAVLAPSYLSLVLPISVLVSLLYALGQLHRHNEITAMRAAGVGLFRATRLIWIVTAGLSGLLFYLNGSVIPWSVEESRLVRDNLRFAHQARTTGRGEEVGLVYRVAYDNPTTHRRWMIARFSEYSHRAFDIQLSELDENGRELRRFLAGEGFWDEITATWEFLHGREVLFDAATGNVTRIIAFAQRVFEDVHDNPEWMLLFEKKPSDLSFFELRRIIGSPHMAGHPRLDTYAVRYHALLAGTFSCLIATGLAIPFAVSGVRVNPAVGVSKSIALFALFFVLSFIGNQLGEQGAVEPWLAAWLPNAFMAGLAFWFMFRVR